MGVLGWAVLGSLAIVAYDAITAFGANLYGYEYGTFPPGLMGSLLIHAVPPFLAGRDSGMIRTAVAVSAVIGFVDATVGWAVSWFLIGGAAAGTEGASPVTIILTVALVTGLFAVVGLAAGAIAIRTRRVPVE